MHNVVDAMQDEVLDFSGPGQRNLTLPISKDDYPHIQVTKSFGTRVLDSYHNLRFLLSKFNAEIRYNLMKREPEIIFPGLYTPAENIANYLLGLVDHMATLNHMPTTKLATHLDMIALENTFHPIVECMATKPWDGGEPRLELFTTSLETTNPILTCKIVKTWMVAAIAAAHSDTGFINQGVLVLQGPQNIGKTTWVKSLDPINCGAVKEGVFLDPTNKDSIAQIASYWIVELGELDSIFGKAAIGRLKSYITMEYDLLRTPYARKPTKLSRRTAYIATVNEQNYLIDDTGNRRWWTIKVNKIHYDHGLNMQQIWAEAYAIWQSGHPTYLPQELQNEVNEMNKEHERSDPMEEKVLSEYDWESPSRRRLSASAILEEMGYARPSKNDSTNFGKILTRINGKDSVKINGVRTHEIPTFRRVTERLR